MTNKHVSILIAAFLIGTISNAQESTPSKESKIRVAELNQAIISLFQSGVISTVEANTLVNRASLLEELNKQGRVVTLNAADSSICAKPK